MEPLALSIAHELIANDWVDHEFINKYVYGYEEYSNYVKEYTPEKEKNFTGVPAEQIRQAAKMIHESRLHEYMRKVRRL